MKIKKKRKSITQLFLEGRPIDAALRRAGREALKRHQAAGQPIVDWRDGKIVEVPPAAIIRSMKRKRPR